MLLEGGLHADVPLGRDVVRRDEHALPLGRHFGEVDVPLLRDPLHQLFAVPALALRDRDEVLVHVRHHHAGLVAHERNGEQRLEPDEQPAMMLDRAGRRDRGDVAVAEQLHRADALAVLVARARLVRAPDATAPTRGTGHAPRRAARSPSSLSTSTNSITLAAELHAFRRCRTRCRGARARRQSPSRQGRCGGCACDSASISGSGYLLTSMMLSRKCVLSVDVAPERVPVHLPVVHVVADVDRAEVADVVRQQRLLAARIRRLVGAEVRHGVVAVRFVDEEARRAHRCATRRGSSCPTPRARRAGR